MPAAAALGVRLDPSHTTTPLSMTMALLGTCTSPAAPNGTVVLSSTAPSTPGRVRAHEIDTMPLGESTAAEAQGTAASSAVSFNGAAAAGRKTILFHADPPTA